MAHLKRLLLAAAFLGLSTGANAALITFDFTGGGPNGNVLTFEEIGVTLTAQGERDFAPSRIQRNARGLGIQALNNQIDSQSSDTYEGISFSVDQPATWVSVSFFNFSNNEGAYLCGIETFLEPFCDNFEYVFGSGGNALESFSLANHGFSSLVSIGNDQVHRGRFRIASITIDAAAVPAPATLGLLGLGLIGLGLARRKRV